MPSSTSMQSALPPGAPLDHKQLLFLSGEAQRRLHCQREHVLPLFHGR